ncbi:MAG: hypothetical protein Q9219_004233 [cf. Caloplaca sp. 3 TL-2023]
MSLINDEFLLVPHDIPNDRIPVVPKSLHQPVVVTDMWIERNLHRKQFVRPDANVTNMPFTRFPIPSFERLVVCSTRFEDVDLLHMSRAVRLMGAIYDEDFSPKASVLICNKLVAGHEKLRHAQHWNVPAVTAEWLWDCIRSGEFREFEHYLLQPWLPKSRSDSDEVQKQTRDQVGAESKGEARSTKENGSDQTARAFSRPVKEENKVEEDRLKKPNNDEMDHTPIPLIPKPPPNPTRDALVETSPNCSPPKSSKSPSKPTATHHFDPPTKKPPSQDPALSSAINSLLAHHQNARSTRSNNAATTTTTAAQNPPPRPTVRRRKRQLFGRAPSNLSNLSRASSVDTVNTDGVGTPVELTRSTSNLSSSNNNNNNSNLNLPLIPPTNKPSRTATDDLLPFDPLAAYSDEHAEDDDKQSSLQMTQLGYEDPDALAWREKVERKLGTVVVRKEEEGRRVKEIGRVKDSSAGRGGRRTRQQGGR